MALCVVAIHVNPLTDLPGGGAFLTGGIARVAVPVFFLINGYYFESVAQGAGTPAYVHRLLWLFAIWSVLYLPAWSWALVHPDLWPLARFVVMGWWHLWYLPGLAIAALCGALIRDVGITVQIAIMVVSFAVGVAIIYALALDRLHPSELVFGDMTVLHRNGLFLGLPFLLGGMLIRRYDLEHRFDKPALTGVAVLSLLLVVAEGIWFREVATGLANHDNLASLGMAAPAIFLLALKFNAPSPSRRLGVYANGLFFLHVAFCVIGFRFTDLSHLWIFCIAVAGSVAVTFVMIRVGLARRLL